MNVLWVDPPPHMADLKVSPPGLAGYRKKLERKSTADLQATPQRGVAQGRNYTLACIGAYSDQARSQYTLRPIRFALSGEPIAMKVTGLARSGSMDATAWTPQSTAGLASTFGGWDASPWRMLLRELRRRTRSSDANARILNLIWRENNWGNSLFFR